MEDERLGFCLYQTRLVGVTLFPLGLTTIVVSCGLELVTSFLEVCVFWPYWVLVEAVISRRTPTRNTNNEHFWSQSLTIPPNYSHQ